MRHFLAGDGLDDVRTGDEEVGGVFDLEDEVGDGGRVHGTAGTRSHDDRDLGDDARGPHVALEDAPVPVEATTPSWIRAPPESLRPMSGAPLSIARSMTLQILSATTSPRLPPKRGEVLGEDEDGPTVDCAPPGHDGVTGGRLSSMPKPAAWCRTNMVDLLERAFVEEEFDSLARGQLAERRAGGRWLAGCRGDRLLAQFPQLLDTFFGAHRSSR